MGSNVSRKKIRQKILEIREQNGVAKVKRVKKKKDTYGVQ